MLAVRGRGGTEAQQIAAVLHHVSEDCDVPDDVLNQRFPAEDCDSPAGRRLRMAGVEAAGPLRGRRSGGEGTRGHRSFVPACGVRGISPLQTAHRRTLRLSGRGGARVASVRSRRLHCPADCTALDSAQARTLWRSERRLPGTRWGLRSRVRGRKIPWLTCRECPPLRRRRHRGPRTR
jgi:hypothetical protein